MRAKKYGITKSEYMKILASQDGRCAVCRVELVTTGNRRDVAAVDHDHETGKVRGILCLLCNAALGLVRDDPETIKGLLRYLGYEVFEKGAVA